MSESLRHTHVLTQRQRIQAIMGACSGNLVEWFDFFVYAYTAIYFASLFFPHGDQATQLMATAGIFAVGFFMRPIGGWLFGWIADTRGRRFSMVISVFLMCGGSLVIAVLPTYDQIGIAAPILLLVARLLQGLSVGAEYGTGATYISEISTPGRRSFFGSFQYFTIIAGQLLALLTIVALQNMLDPADLKSWGWRIPFAIGAFGALVVVYLRRSMLETGDAKAMKSKDAGSIRVLWQHKRDLALTVVITAGCSLFFYTFTTYMQKYLVVTAGMPASSASIVMTVALVFFMFLQPAFGALADHIGIRISMMIFGAGAALFSVPLLTMLKSTTSPVQAFFLVLMGLVICAFYTPVTGVLKADLFPASIRALGVGFPYAIGNALCGGTAEYVALFLRGAGAENSYFYYVAVMGGLVFIAAWLMPDLRRHGYLDGDGTVEQNSGMRRKKAGLGQQQAL